MFPVVLLLYLVVGLVMASIWGRAEHAAPLVIASGVLSTLSLILPLGKRLPGFGILYVRVTDNDRAIIQGGFGKPFLGNMDLEGSLHEGKTFLKRTGLYDTLAFFAWLFVLYAILANGALLPLLRFWRDLIAWLPSLFAGV